MVASPSVRPASASRALKPLKGVRVVSLALNLPGPAALMRLRGMGALCVKVEPPAGDPMRHYSVQAYADMHQGIQVLKADLKTPAGQARLHRQLAKADVLLTSFRPSALSKLGLDWKSLKRQYPALSLVAIVGAPGPRAEEPGHDLTYLAEAGLVPSLELPPSLLADMGGSLMASEAVLKAVLTQRNKGTGVCVEVALSDAAGWLAQPHRWGLTVPGSILGGAHAGYKVYPCKDGRVAVAALEPHFAAALCASVGCPMPDVAALFRVETHQAVAAFLVGKTRKQLDRLAAAKDIPLHTLPA